MFRYAILLEVSQTLLKPDTEWVLVHRKFESGLFKPLIRLGFRIGFGLSLNHEHESNLDQASIRL